LIKAISHLQVAVVVVNWNQPTLTLNLVGKLITQTIKPLVIVVDNGSDDNSINSLKRGIPEDVLLIVRDVNDGFGVGCNAGIQIAMTMNVDYVWLLNNDALPNPECLENLLKVAKTDSLIGAVGARIIDPSNVVTDHAGAIMNKFTLNCRYSISADEINASTYSWITGACMLLSTEALAKVGGGFYKGFFMYWEDADLCSRLKNNGYKLSVSTDALVSHHPGTSSDKYQYTRFGWHIDSQTLFVNRNFKYVKLGLLLIYIRHLGKSIISLDIRRLKMTIKKIYNSKNSRYVD